MITHDQIATRAYFAWIEAGQPQGQHEQHWARAENELRAEADGVPPVTDLIAFATLTPSKPKRVRKPAAPKVPGAVATRGKRAGKVVEVLQ